METADPLTQLSSTSPQPEVEENEGDEHKKESEKSDANLVERVLQYCSLVLTDTAEENSKKSQKDSSMDFYLINKKNEHVWSQLFHHYFRTKRALEEITHDDCLYFVKWHEQSNTSSPRDKKKKDEPEERFFVRRRDGKTLPIATDPMIHWEETFFLNVLLHRFEYTIEVSIRTKEVDVETKKRKLKLLTKVSKKVYAVPNKVRMDQAKAEEVAHTYPMLYFAIDDFSEHWKDIKLEEDNQLVCVELFASGNFFNREKTLRSRVFAGALDYEVMKKEYAAKKWMWTSATASHFFNLRGPNGKGAAQMAVCAEAVQEGQSSPEQEGKESGGWLSPSAWNKWGSSTLKRVAGNRSGPPVLTCSLTFLNLRWDQLMKDILSAVQKKMEPNE